MHGEVIRAVVAAAGPLQTGNVLFINGKLTLEAAVLADLTGNIVGNGMTAAPVAPGAIALGQGVAEPSVVPKKGIAKPVTKFIKSPPYLFVSIINFKSSIALSIFIIPLIIQFYKIISIYFLYLSKVIFFLSIVGMKQYFYLLDS